MNPYKLYWLPWSIFSFFTKFDKNTCKSNLMAEYFRQNFRQQSVKTHSLFPPHNSFSLRQFYKHQPIYFSFSPMSMKVNQTLNIIPYIYLCWPLDLSLSQKERMFLTAGGKHKEGWVGRRCYSNDLVFM